MPTSAHSVVSALLHALLWSAIAQGRTTVEAAMYPQAPGPAPEASHEAAQPPAPAPAAAQGPGEVAIQSLPYSSGGDGSISTGDGSVTAANATSLGSGLIFNGAGQIVSSGSGFGDSPSTYTGKQSWPELLGINALLAKSQLAAETKLHVVLVAQGSAVTDDYRTDRIRVFYDPATYAVVPPAPAVG